MARKVCCNYNTVVGIITDHLVCIISYCILNRYKNIEEQWEQVKTERDLLAQQISSGSSNLQTQKVYYTYTITVCVPLGMR